MSKITLLEATGIKEQRFSIEPAPVTVITGENFSGKTAIKNALELALLGYVPGLGKTNKSTFELSNGEPMGVELSVDGKLAISRLWKEVQKKGGNSIAHTETVNLEVPPVMLELGSVFDKPKAERLKYFFNLAKVEELSWEKVTAAIKAVQVDEPTETTEKAITSVIAKMNTAKGENIQERLQDALGIIKDQTKTVSAEVKDLEGFVRTQTRQTDIELQAPVNNARAKVQEARKAYDVAKTNVQLHENLLQDLQAKRDKLAHLGEPRVAAESPEPELQSETIEDDGQLEKIESDIKQFEAQIETAKANCDTALFRGAQQRVTALSSIYASQHSEVAELIRRGNELKAKITEVKADRARDSAMTCCPTCLADGESWKDRLLAKYDDQLRDLAEQFGQSKRDYKAKAHFLNDAKVDLETAQKNAQDLSSAQRLLNDLHGKLQLLAADRNKLIYARQKQDEAIRAENKRRMEQHRLTVEFNIKAVAQENAQRENLKAEIAATDEAQLKEDLATSESALLDATEKVEDADTALRTETANFAKEQDRMKSLMRREIVEAELLILKESTKVLLALQEDAIKSTFEPLLDIANKFTDGILKEHLAFHETEFGYWRNGHFVGHNVFSGTEEALAYTGLMVALATVSGSPVKVVIIDEMGRFDPRKIRPAVMERMLDLTHDGVIDHAFLIDNDPAFYDAWKDGIDVLVHEVTA